MRIKLAYHRTAMSAAKRVVVKTTLLYYNVIQKQHNFMIKIEKHMLRNEGVGGSSPSCGTSPPSKDV